MGTARCPVRHQEALKNMPNHLTPAEVAKEFRMDKRDVIRLCVEEHVPIYHGKIDKTLFSAVRGEQAQADGNAVAVG